MKDNYRVINISEANMAFIQKFDDHKDDYITIAHIMYDDHDRIYWYLKPDNAEYFRLNTWFITEYGYSLTDYYETDVDR